MLLAIDIGNTRIKAAVFEENRLVELFTFTSPELKNALPKIFGQYQINDVVVSSVGLESIDINIPSNINLHKVSRDWHFPFENKYTTPETLGIDRMVLASGSVLQFPGKNRLVIDAGTCVTYDFIDDHNVYHGGAISPGISIRYKAMHDYTSRLPMLERADRASVVGASTSDSMHSGVINGIAFEIDGFIDEYAEKYSNFIIILTGGDADFLAGRLKNTIFASSNFLLESLNKTFQYKNH